MLLSTPAISIAGRRVACDMPPYVIAELGINHGGSLDRALALVDAAAAAGAHAIKLQTIVARELVAPECPAPAHVNATSMVQFFEQFELDEAAHHAVAARARSLGLAVMSSAFSEAAVDLLERVGVDAYKIASGDITWDHLIARCAATGKPLLMSTGMSSLGEVQHALDIAGLAGARDVALLHCVSAYPVPEGSENLLAIQTLADECRVPIGLSDHGHDTFALPLAVALGACLYERHLVLEGDESAIDGAVSSTPAQLESAVANARRAWMARGDGRKVCLPAESANLVPSRRSLCAARDLPAGTVLTPDALVALRPGIGYTPGLLLALCGLAIARPVSRGTPITAAHFEHPARAEQSRVA